MPTISPLRFLLVAHRRAFFLSLALFAATALAQTNTPPVLDDLVQANRVAPSIPGGRALLFPVTASDADGDRLTYTVTSSKKHILARVKTGNPFLKFSVNHAGNGTPADPAYAGDLYFMLLRDWTPITAGFIGGFAQRGYYDGLIFHRITSLGAGATGFIFQGGDPLGTGGGGPGFKFDNELDPALLFVGRGQLAMANSGTDTPYIANPSPPYDYTDSNGSQFFITDGQPRHLDFNHTIFAQLVRGWELLPSLRGTKTTGSAPDVAVTLTGASVLPYSGPNNTDAVLALSALAAGDSTITVTVDDGRGGRATKSFVATGVKETSNTPPFLRKIAPLVTPKNTDVFFNLEPVDLEFDLVDSSQIQHRVITGYPNGGSTSNGARAGYRPVTNDDGLVSMGFDLAQFDVSEQSFSSTRLATNAFIGVGDRIAIGEPVLLEGAPGVALSNVVAGKIRDFDPAGAPGDFTATINWGDGTALTAGTLGRDTASVGASLLTVSGTHTYARAGIYPVVVNFSGVKGVVGTARGQAVISAADIRAAGETLQIAGAMVKNRVLATFSDNLSTGTPGDYSARIDWGDGVWSDGVVAEGIGGRFIVRGTHTYRDAEVYAVQVRIHRDSDPPGVNEAWAWSTVELSFSATPHLPPFPKPNLVAAWQSLFTKSATGLPGPDYKVQLGASFIILNTGNRRMPRGNIRYWFSNDAVLSKATDVQLKVRPSSVSVFVPQIPVLNFPAGGNTGNVPLALPLPKGESGGRKYLIVELAYHDPLTDVEAIDKVFAKQIGPEFLVKATSNLQTTEAGGTATFTVMLDTQPTADVTIPLATTKLDGTPTTEGSVSPTQLVFTPANWNVAQTVTATGLDDTIKDGPQTFVVRLNAVTSTDTLYSGLNPPDVTMTNLDNEP